MQTAERLSGVGVALATAPGGGPEDLGGRPLGTTMDEEPIAGGAMNLFLDDLEKTLVNDDAIRQFLQLADPPELRPQEGLHLDFKEDLVQDLGDHVAAMANSYGGLILLGVRETKGQSFVVADALVGVRQQPVELKNKLENIIATSVRPRPTCSIGIVPVQKLEGRCAVVLRIEEGLDPPYMYVQGGQNRVPIRTPGSTRPASLEDLRQLFQKARRLRREAGRNRPDLGNLSLMQAGEPLLRYQKLIWLPLLPTIPRLDRVSEGRFRRCIDECWPGHPRFTGVERRSTYTHFQMSLPEMRSELLWAVSSHGEVGFITPISRWLQASDLPGKRIETAVVGDWIIAAASFISLIQGWANVTGYPGGGALTQEMAFVMTDDVLFKAGVRSALEGSFGVLKGIFGLKPKIESRLVVSTKSVDFNPSRAERPDIVDLLGNLFLDHLRDLGALVDWDLFCQDVNGLLENLDIPRPYGAERQR